METTQTLLNKFKAAFVESLQEIPLSELSRFKVPGERKFLLGGSVMRLIAKKLGLEYVPEFLRIDYALCKKGEDGWNVPKICIESENSWDSAYEEVLKLTSINAPLKVLINYGMNQDKRGEIEKDNLNDWYILNDFLKEGQLCGWYMILIYDDTENEIKFHSFVYNEKGEKIEKECEPIIIKNGCMTLESPTNYL